MIQPRVSVVMPCYNKGLYIDNMLSSVLGQDWDNIELIFVNDGSTDNTSEIISRWESKLRDRGYSVIVINQENQGVGAAVRRGLAEVSGKYVCQIDADDALHTDYVRKLAGVLEENPECDWVSCNIEAYRGGLDNPDTIEVWGELRPMSGTVKIEHFVLNLFNRHFMRIIAKTEYLKKNIELSRFAIYPRASQEPQLWIPLLAGEGNLKCFEDRLYKYNCKPEGITRSKAVEKRIAYEEGYFELIKQTLDGVHIEGGRKENILKLASLQKGYQNLITAIRFEPASAQRAASVLLDELKGLFAGDFGITEEDILEDAGGCYMALAGAMDTERREQIKEIISGGCGRIFGYGAKGRVAAVRVPKLAGTRLEPAVLWDKSAAAGDAICGIPVTKPEFEALAEDDILLIFPKAEAVVSEINATMRQMKIKCRVCYYDEIIRLSSALRFSPFYMCEPHILF